MGGGLDISMLWWDNNPLNKKAQKKTMNAPMETTVAKVFKPKFSHKHCETKIIYLLGGMGSNGHSMTAAPAVPPLQISFTSSASEQASSRALIFKSEAYK